MRVQATTSFLRARPARRPTIAVIGRAVLCVAAAAGCRSAAPPERLVERPSGPLTLDDAVALALRNNPDARIAARRTEAARAAIDQAVCAYLPDVAIGERATRTSAPSRAFGNLLDQRRFDDSIDFNDPGQTTNFRSEASLGLTLYDFGRRRSRVVGAEAGAAGLAADEEAVRRDLALEVARAFVAVFDARDAADAEESAAAASRRIATIVEARAEEGAARPADVLYARADAARAEHAAVAAGGAALRADAALRIVLGLGVEESLHLVDPPTGDVRAPGDLSELLVRARERRPEIVRARHGVGEAAAALDGARASAYPDLGLSATAGFDDPHPRLGHGNWFLGLDLLQSLTEIACAPARVREAMARLEVARERARKAELEVEGDVRRALLDAEEADARRAAAGRSLALTESLARRARAEYEEGASQIADVLAAEVAATRARSVLSQAERDRMLSRIAIAHAAGDYPADPIAREREVQP